MGRPAEPLIRPAVPGDEEAITVVRRANWLAAYDGLIAPDRLKQAVSQPSSYASQPPYRRTLVALAGEPPQVIGYASYGPQRWVATATGSAPRPQGRLDADAATPTAPVAEGATPGVLTPAGRAGETGELYALYVAPDWWSAGAGRTLAAEVLAALRSDGYRNAVLWTLTGNARARRFYQRAGFAPDGAVNILAGLGGVEELRYARAL